MAPPLTGFETDGTTTTLAHEAAFLATIAAETDASYQAIGTSVQGRTIHRLDVGNPAGSTWLLLTLSHANEPGAREAVLAFVRDLAYSTAPADVAYKAAHRLVVVTPQNPDGLANGTRNNSDGVDINQDHLRLRSPEARAVATVFADTRPDVALDAHEEPGTGPQQIKWLDARTLAVHPDLRQLSRDVVAKVAADVAAAGFTVAEYSMDINRISGREVAALHHAVSMLLETPSGKPLAQRVGAYLAALRSVQAWHAANLPAIRAAVARSRTDARENAHAYPLQTGMNVAAGAWPVQMLPDNLLGYQLAAPFPDAAVAAAWGLTVEGNLFVPMTQEAWPVVPLLLDPASQDKRVTAYRVLDDRRLPSGALLGYRVGVDGASCPVVRIRHRVNGRTREVQLPGT